MGKSRSRRRATSPRLRPRGPRYRDSPALARAHLIESLIDRQERIRPVDREIRVARGVRPPTLEPPRFPTKTAPKPAGVFWRGTQPDSGSSRENGLEVSPKVDARNGY